MTLVLGYFLIKAADFCLLPMTALKIEEAALE